MQVGRLSYYWVMSMICQRCGFSLKENVCRKCLFYRQFLTEVEGLSVVDKGEIAKLPFRLTTYQQDVAKTLCLLAKEHDIFLEAVCGAGKTEICIPLIEQTLRCGQCVCWAVPRREIVLELHQRFQNYFPNFKITCVCGGQTDDLIAPFIVCTTHQLYRYEKQFDLLILDEPDAFPFANNESLLRFVSWAAKGRRIYLSATRDSYLESLQKQNLVKHLYASLRPSGRLLPVPIYIQTFFPLVRMLFDFYKYRYDYLLIFVPTRKCAQFLANFLRCPFITSESEQRSMILERFRNYGGTLVCTTILERGVTFKKCNVYVLYADHPVFSTATLVQIAGRVERGMNPEKGVCKCFFRERTKSLSKCMTCIMEANNHAISVLKRLKQNH